MELRAFISKSLLCFNLTSAVLRREQVFRLPPTGSSDSAHRAQCGECTRPHWRGVLPKRDDAASAQITPRGNLVGLAATAYVLLGCSGRITRHSDIGLEFLRKRCSWPEVLIWEALGGHPPVTPQGSERPIAVTEPTKNRSTSP
jgi:hypothetical protein